MPSSPILLVPIFKNKLPWHSAAVTWSWFLFARKWVQLSAGCGRNTQGHVIRKWQIWDLNPCFLNCSLCLSLPAWHLSFLAFFLFHSSIKFPQMVLPLPPLIKAFLSPFGFYFSPMSFLQNHIVSHALTISHMWWTPHYLSGPTLIVKKSLWTLESDRLGVKYQHCCVYLWDLLKSSQTISHL